MLNHIQLIGFLGADPEIRTTGGGEDVASLRLATSERWKDRATGEKRERTEWHSVVVFGPIVAVVKGYVKKGSKIYIAGQLRTRKWQDNSGNDRYSTEVVLSGFDAKLLLLDSAGGSGGGSRDYSGYSDGPSRGGAAAGAGAGSAAKRGGSAFDDDLDDDVPF